MQWGVVKGAEEALRQEGLAPAVSGGHDVALDCLEVQRQLDRLARTGPRQLGVLLGHYHIHQHCPPLLGGRVAAGTAKRLEKHQKASGVASGRA